MSVISHNEEKNLRRTYKANTKTHSTLEEKNVIPLYTEHVHFLMKRAGWLVTKIYQHLTFEQSNFEKDFVVMNQKLQKETLKKTFISF